MEQIKKQLKSVSFLALLIILIISGCKNTNNNAKVGDDVVFADSTIKVGYISYPPGFIIDPNTKEKSGIFNDVLVEIAKRNNLTINYKEEVTWATMIEAISTNRVDLIANPVWATPERKAVADFSIPIYFSPIGIYVRADDNRFDTDISKLNDPKVRIAAVDGEINYSIGKFDFPLAEVKPFPNNIDVAQLYLEIQAKRKDVTFAEPMFAYDYMQKNPGKIKNIGEKAPIRNYPNGYMYKKGNSKTGDFLNTEIEKLLKDGTIDKIIGKYLPFEGAVISATDSLAIERQ
ncbi:amino acid ABC transporter substrate-binding protein [Bacteroidia bacterium]|nr:amino acid ABC transporter substrate-binding protein [Bacteroidia bacterium]